MAATSERRAGGTDLLIERLALTPDPAQVCMEPVAFYEGDLRERRSWRIPERNRGLVERAASLSRSRSGSDPIEVYDADPDRAERRDRARDLDERAGMGPLRHGPASPILKVS